MFFQLFFGKKIETWETPRIICSNTILSFTFSWYTVWTYIFLRFSKIFVFHTYFRTVFIAVHNHQSEGRTILRRAQDAASVWPPAAPPHGRGRGREQGVGGLQLRGGGRHPARAAQNSVLVFTHTRVSTFLYLAERTRNFRPGHQ